MSNKIEYISSGPPMMKAPQMTQGGLQRIQLHNRPEISETQHTLTYDDDADSIRRTPIRLVFAKNMSSFALELMQFATNIVLLLGWTGSIHFVFLN